MTPEFAKYLADCRAQGMSDQQIRAGLLDAGWQPEQIDAAFPVSEVKVEAKPEVKPEPVVAPKEDAPLFGAPQKKRWPLVVGVILGLLILLSGTVAFAEHGYFPALSRVYRKTLLPLAWKGTTGNAGLSISQALASTITTRPIKAVTAVNLQLDFNSTVGTALLPAGSKQLADATQTKPSKLNFTFTTTVDTLSQIASNVEVNIDKNDPIRDLVNGYFNPDFTKLTVDSVIPASGNAVYERTNALPSATIADVQQWFKIPFGNEGINTIHTQQATVQHDLTTNGDMRTELMNAVNGMTTDKGVVRHNGEAEAWYTTVITPSKAQELGKDHKLPETIRSTFAQLADGWTGGQISLDWYLTVRNPILRELTLTAQTTDTDGTFGGTIDLQFTYGGSVEKVKVPESSQVWHDPITYLQSIQAAYPNLNSTGIFTKDGLGMALNLLNGDTAAASGVSSIETENELRQSDVTAIAKAIEAYKQDNDSHVPGNTSAKYVRLDTTDNPLCGVSLGIDCLQLDPNPDYYYSYWTDGDSYRVVAVQLGDDGKPNGFYVIQDGATLGVVPTLP